MSVFRNPLKRAAIAHWQSLLPVLASRWSADTPAVIWTAILAAHGKPLNPQSKAALILRSFQTLERRFATQVVVSRGYDGAAAIKFSEKGDAVRFRIGKKVYDPNAENNARWINMAVKGFGPICERIKKMQLKDGSFVNLIGRLDEDVWEDQQTHEKKSAMVIILDDIEYASGGGKSKDSQNTDEAQGHPAASTAPATPAAAPANNGGFTGYESFGGGNSFFDEN